ncbi:MAG: cellulase family glycosylhydrolase [Parabacteroides sp.]|nr:cellulase family glycosylhydrolase [Parabacteroides sp.]
MRNIINLFLCLLLFSCSEGKEQLPFLQVRNGIFIDENGHQVILNGINHVVKNPELKYLHNNDEQLFKDFQKYGFNCIRYGIIWDGLEPEPGVINENYLKEIDKRVKWAEDNGIYLILDMHQDLYGRKFSDGAPEWATLTDNLPHQTGDVWSDSYLISPAVQRAFDNFWQNKPASDGTGIQDHYINVWKTLAARYADSPSVAGFDIMNEPFMGSPAPSIFGKLLEGYAIALTQKGEKIDNPEMLAATFSNEQERIKILEKLDDKELFRQILKSASEPVKDFEENILSPFYQKTRDAIRSTGSRQVLFLEHCYFCNMGIPSYFKVPVQEDGKEDSNCAYAPHGYDLVTDTEAMDSPGYNRTEVIFEQIFENGKDKNLPVWIGEWGAFYMGKSYIEPAMHITNMIEKSLSGQTYWCWWENIETQDYFHHALSRAYPMNSGARIAEYNNNNNCFSCKWETDKENSTIKFYIPQLRKIADNDIKLSPECETERIYIDKDYDSGYLILKIKRGKGELNIISHYTDTLPPGVTQNHIN